VKRQLHGSRPHHTQAGAAAQVRHAPKHFISASGDMAAHMVQARSAASIGDGCERSRALVARDNGCPHFDVFQECAFSRAAPGAIQTLQVRCPALQPIFRRE
jgi:hypothetical protein